MEGEWGGCGFYDTRGQVMWFCEEREWKWKEEEMFRGESWRRRR
jgi:hypothetical protein